MSRAYRWRKKLLSRDGYETPNQRSARVKAEFAREMEQLLERLLAEKQAAPTA